MDKPATTNFEINSLLKKRWSPRSFTDQEVNKEILLRIFEAARWAPSSRNEQPWRFILGLRGDNTWGKIFDTLVEFNQNWAKLAPVLVLAIGKKVSGSNNRPNNIFKYDVGQSVAYMTFQVMQEGLYIHQMGGFDTEKAATLFKIPEEYQPLTVLAIGYKGEPELLPEDLQESERLTRKRLELESLIFSEEFGRKSVLI